ncbi:MAG: PHP domain-containing protein, partial [Clostridia bacterium]|nr:PHP domain-containing protein [Clostridia bacterium]
AKKLVEMAKGLGLEAIAIADHESIASVEEGVYWGGKFGVEVISACEIVVKHREKTLHLLGYYIDTKNKKLLALFNKVNENRKQVIDVQIEKLREAGFYLEKDKVMADCNYKIPVGGSYVNVIFADKRNIDNPIIKEYMKKDNYVIRFLFDYLNVGRPYYVPQFVPEALDVIKIIEESGGVPILAHPGSNLDEEETYIIDDLIKYGILGLEVYTSHHDEAKERYYFKYCQDNKLLYTCGSDFHGRFKPKVKMGNIKNNNYEVVEALKKLHINIMRDR